MAPRTRSGGKRDQKPGTGKEFNTDRPKKKCRLQQIVCENTETKNSHIIDSMAPVLNIESMPVDVMLEIFRHLSHNELCRISRVCRKRKEYTESPVLWKEVNVKLFLKSTDVNENFLTFAGKLPFTVTHLKLDFDECFYTTEGTNFVRLNFEEFCVELNGKCANLHTLVMCNASLSVDLSSVINLCSKFLSNLKVLILPDISFADSEDGSEHDGSSKIEILDVSCSSVILGLEMQSISKMPCLQKLSLWGADDPMLQEAKDFSFLERLEYLNLGCINNVGSKTFQILRNHARNLTELFLCRTNLHDRDFIFNNAFPVLKSICLEGCPYITCEGIKSLLQSCQSLENIYVYKDFAETWAKHPFNTANILGILKSPLDCGNHEKFLSF